MKNKVKPLSSILLIVIFLFSFGNQAFGQEKINLSTGFGIPELMNIGVRYQLEQVQIGLSVGSIPIKNENVISISGDVRYHFGGISELSNRRPWYGRIGLNSLREETQFIIHKYMFLNTRIGRDFNISDKIGIEIDLGVGFQLSHDKTIKNPPSGWFWLIDIEPIAIPSFSIGLFYRI